MPMEDSIEPSYDVVRNVIQGFGFQLEVINDVVFTVFSTKGWYLTLLFILISEGRDARENALRAER